MTPAQRREDNLIRQARSFNDDIRWARWEQLPESLPRDEALLMRARASAIGDDLVMADYEVTGISFASGSEAATVRVRFDWYTKREPTLRSTSLEQRWENKSGRWLLMRQARTRGDRLALFPEPATSAPGAAPPPDGGAPAAAAKP